MTTDTKLAGVFINCPFDAQYRKCHFAILLTVVACGLQPRSALESSSVSVPRMKRISRALRESEYSIHDLTRAYGDDQTRLARFNMPFEFGMAFLLAESLEDSDTSHDWLGLLPEAHRYGEFISDLAGYDLQAHNGTPETVIPPVLAWLSTRPGLPTIPREVNPASLCTLMGEFLQLIEAEDLRWKNHLPWQRLVEIARDLVASRIVPPS